MFPDRLARGAARELDAADVPAEEHVGLTEFTGRGTTAA